jgi:hypothetical protein
MRALPLLCCTVVISVAQLAAPEYLIAQGCILLRQTSPVRHDRVAR